jgi:predicted nucleic acid-binding protein
MKVVVDTSVWSLALRRGAVISTGHVSLLTDLLHDDRIAMLGPIRQELLSGIRHEEQFGRLQIHLRAFPDELLKTADHETAAEYFNRCMAAGIQGSHTDFLICAFAANRRYPILTLDGDFERYAAQLPVDLLNP